MNGEAVKKTIAAGLMCSCKIANFSKFDRKSYFYPDMPKNYQISQFDLPLCGKGEIHIYGKGFSGAELPDKIIGITRIHLEEDVAKSTHFTGFSGIDFNRAGVPLMEIVSEPDMASPDEAYAYLTALKEIMQYGEISECDMEKGQMRCDVNISVRPVGQKELGTKIEVKNLNSFRAVHRSLCYEIERQTGFVRSGGILRQETRGWDDDAGASYLLRSKESAHDYRYFPDPDLMPMNFTDEEIGKIRASLPELPEDKRKRFVEGFGLTPYDAFVLTSERALSEYFEEGSRKTTSPKNLANWIITELLRELGERKIKIEQNPVSSQAMAELVELVLKGTITGKTAKDVFSEMFSSGEMPSQIVSRKGLLQISDSSEIEGIVLKVIADNPSQLEQFRSGKTAVLQFFVGQTMKLSKGKANPKIVNELLGKHLNISNN